MDADEAGGVLRRLLALIEAGEVNAPRRAVDALRGARLAVLAIVSESSSESVCATAQLDTLGDMTDTETLSAIGYARVSTSEQDRTGYGLAAQRRAITREIEHRGWTLTEMIEDGGESGKDLDRPGVRDVLERLADGGADALVVHKLDRLTRSVLDLAELLAWSVRVGVRLIFLDLGIDTGTPNGRLVATIMSGVAEWEREQISARTLDAASERRAQGKRMGRPGVRDTNPALAERIRAEREAGMSWQTITDRLNAESVPTVRGAATWHRSSVRTAGGYVRPTAKAKRITLPEPKRSRKTTARAHSQAATEACTA